MSKVLSGKPFEMVSLDTLLRTPAHDVTVNFSLQLPENPSQWMMTITATGNKKDAHYVHQARYDPLGEKTPYKMLGHQMGLKPNHPLYGSLVAGDRFPVEDLVGWLIDAQVGLYMKGIQAHVKFDINARAESNSPVVHYPVEEPSIPPY